MTEQPPGRGRRPDERHTPGQPPPPWFRRAVRQSAPGALAPGIPGALAWAPAGQAPVGPQTGDSSTPAALEDAVAGMRTAKTSGVVRAGALMAVATVVSRVTGLLAKIALAAALGATVVNNSYTLANTLPNIVFELLIGGVLTSVAIPLLTRAQHSDADGGTEYTQRLMTLVVVGLVGATALAIVTAPLLTRLYLSGSRAVDLGLATDLARLLLPQILFYGIAAMFGAILNTKERFAANAWAPVVNNLVVIGVAVVLFSAGLRGNGNSLDRAGTLLLGVGSTLGIVAQAAVMLPSLRRAGFRFRWRWGWDKRLGEAGGLVGWAVVYVLVSQVGVVLTTRIASGDDISGGVTVFQTASLLFQMPYGILGVAVLTAIMPRLSRHAAAGQMEQVKQDMSLANRLSAVALLPVSAGLLVIGSAVAVVLFDHGRFSLESALLVGGTLGGMALGLLPLAMTLVQMRVFYAMKDGRTPTLINAAMVAVRVPLLLVAATLSPKLIIPGLALATAASYLVGALVGEIWLRARFGPMGTRRTLVTIGKMGVASAGGAAAALLGARAITGLIPTDIPDAIAICLVAGAIGLVTIAVLTFVLRVEELLPVRRRLLGLIRRGWSSGAGTAGAHPNDAPAMGGSANPPTQDRTEVTRVMPTDGGPSDGRDRVPGRQPGVSGGPADEPATEATEPVRPPSPEPARPVADDPTVAVRPASAEPARPVADDPTVNVRGDGPTVNVRPDGPTVRHDPPPVLTPGATVGGRYRLVNLITTDSAGNRFWRAKDTVLPRDMAVTLLADTTAASATVARTLRVGRLHHIGLPQTLDVGTQSGQSYVVGQWVDGATLTDLISGGPLEPEVATSITAKVSEAVAEAHRNGIALGAINPSLVRVNFDGQVRLSHVIAHGNATPDQDIRAVGALLYLMLTGTWPMAGSTAPGQQISGTPGAAPGAGSAPAGGSAAPAGGSAAPAGAPGTPAPGGRAGRRAATAGAAAAVNAAVTAAGSSPPDPTVALDRAGETHGLPPAPTRRGRELPAVQVRPAVPEALSALAQRALHPDDPEGIHAVGAIASLLRQPEVQAPAPEPILDAPVEALRPAARRLIRERRIKLSIAAVMLLAFAALIVIVVASLAKQALAGVQDPSLSESSQPTGSSQAAVSATPTVNRVTRPRTTARSTSETATSKSTSSSTTTSGTPAPAVAAETPDQITGATVYDPQGDGNKDNIGQVQRAFDNDSGSAWQTFVYKQQFPTLKQGVGLTLQLQRSTAPTSITVSSDTPGTKVEIRTASGPDAPLASTRVLGTALVNGLAPTTVKIAGATPSQYLIVFVTQLGSQGTGYQSSLNEITISGS